MSKKKDKNTAEKETTAEEVIDNQTTSEESTSENADSKNADADNLKDELQAQKENYLRLAAEYDNYRKRTTAEKSNIYADATAKAVSELLTVADSLDMAQKSAENAPEEYQKGLELMSNQLASALSKLNVEVFGEIGDDFNPDLHNAVSKIEDEQLGENTIAQVFQKGYKTPERVIRYAMVQVANCD